MSAPRRTPVLAVGAALLLAAPAVAGCAPAGGYGAPRTAPSRAGAAGAGPAEAGPAEAGPAGAAAPTTAPPRTRAPAPAAPGAGVVTTRLVGTSVPRMGRIVTDARGWVLYRFDADTAQPPTSTCVAACAAQWPPVLAATDGPRLAGVDPAKVGTVLRADGARQLTLGGWPLYRYARDTRPGQWKGQGVGGAWFVVQPTGAKNLSCLPAPARSTPAPGPTGPEDGAPDNSGYPDDPYGS